jgi:hypothetical protein
MTKNLFALSIVLVAVVAAGVAAAQPASGSPPAAPAGSAAAAPADSAAPPAPAPAAPAASNPRDACTAAMNADPQFAASIIKIADERAAQKRDADTVAAHVDANFHVQKNERHVIYAYAGMWIIAAGFVIFLWRRQQALRLEIAHLRRDLDAAADSPGPKARS